MAVIFPEGIYTAGQGIFDSRPYMKEIEARKRAKNEAFTKYFDKIKTQVNPAGVRDVDLPFIEKEIEELGRFGVANKKPIGRNGAEKLQFEKMARNIFQRIQGSKNAQKTTDEFAKAEFGDKTEDDMEIYDRSTLSIYDPKYYKEYYVNEAQGLPEYKETRGTPFSLADLTPAVNTLKPTERTQYIQATFGPKEQKMRIDLNTPVQRIGNQYIYTTKYTDDVIKKGAENYASNVKDKPIDKISRTFKKTYNSLMDDATWMASADEVFQKYYGKPIENVRDAAAADALLYYDKLKGEKTSTIPQPRVGRAGGRGGAGDIEIWDAYNELIPALEEESSGFIRDENSKLYHPIKSLGNDYYNLFTKQLKLAENENKKLYPESETFVSLENDGTLGLYILSKDRKKTELITTINERGLNRLANPGQRGFSEVEKKMKTKSPAKAPVKPKKDPLNLGI